MEQTSVEFIVEVLSNYDRNLVQLLDKEITQAKEMHEAEMHKCASFWRGKENDIEKTIFEVYYNETFNK